MVYATPAMVALMKSELTAIEDRKLVFTIEAFDEAGLIGKAYHERFIVASERFVEKTCEKIKNNFKNPLTFFCDSANILALPK